MPISPWTDFLGRFKTLNRAYAHHVVSVLEEHTNPLGWNVRKVRFAKAADQTLLLQVKIEHANALVITVLNGDPKTYIAMTERNEEDANKLRTLIEPFKVVLETLVRMRAELGAQAEFTWEDDLPQKDTSKNP